MAEFTPKQLDALEDALEDLEVDADLDDLDLDPELAARLAEYRQVLALTRDAFPLDEVPEGVLDAVLAEAREVARTTPAPAPEPRESWARAWERWRSSLIPIASLAAAAALVLWIAKPASEGELAVIEPTPTPERERPAAEGPPLEADSAEPAAGASEMMPVEPPGQPTTRIEAPPDETKPPATKTKPKSAGTAAGGGAAAKPIPTPEPAPSVEPLAPPELDKDDAWRELDRADAARRKGECERARKIYDDILAASASSSVVGRAKAGIGLCLEQDGKKTQAETWFEQARTSSPSVDAWIRSQRDEQPLPGEKKTKAKSEAYEPMHDAL